MTFVKFEANSSGYLAGMEVAANEFFSRNKGLLSGHDQQLLANTCVAIAGAGGDGGLLAERLVRIGIGKIILADPEVFDAANFNRQFGANTNSIGQNKAIAVSMELRMINPAADIVVFPEGITPQNVAEFVGAADIVVDEIEYSLPALSVMLQQEARTQQKHVFMGANIGWGASVFCFAPAGVSFEQYFEYNEALGTINPLKYVKDVPGYFAPETQQAILSGTMPMPAISPSVSLVAALMTSEIVLFLTGSRAPLIVPEFLAVDLYDRSICKS